MALSPHTRVELKTLYNALADRVLEPHDPVYVEELNAKAGFGGDPVEELATEIDWQEGGGVCLFTGQRGTGKSTELKRLQARLGELGIVAFYADLSEYVLLTKEIEISDFLVSVAGAMSEQIQARYGASPGNRTYWDRFRDFLTQDVSITEIKIGSPGFDVKAALKSDPEFKRLVQEKSRGYVAQIVASTHAFIAEAVQWVRDKEGDPDRKVVLIIDSVERIRGVGNEAMGVYESVRNLFFSHADSLRIPMLHVVYTVPPYLAILAAGAGSLLGGAVTRRLVSTHIFKDRSREPDAVGLEILHKVVATRFGHWHKVFSIEAIDELAISSGGDLREFFRLIRLCLPSVRDDAQLPLDKSAVATAQNTARNEMLPIPADHLDWLKRISESHQTCLAKDSDLPVLAHFLDNRLVLNYRNGSDWYDIHPLLRPVVDAHGPAAS
ncbi:MAG: hypothetical protein KAX47_14095 [Zoogloea sp.]|nr:hypothetical protein [Zoogloea sp.]